MFWEVGMLAEKTGVLRVRVVKGLRRIHGTFRFYKGWGLEIGEKDGGFLW